MYVVSARRTRLFSTVFGAILVAGCGGGGGSVAPRTADQSQTAPSGAKSAAAFERFRAAVEQSARNSAPPGFTVMVGSTYVTQSGKLVFGDANVAFKTASKIGFALGSKSYVYDRSQLIEIPRTFIETIPSGRRTATVYPICNPDAGDCSGGGPTPPPDPTPTDPPQITINASGSTPEADRIAASRGGPCTQAFYANSYPNERMEWSSANGNTWTLHYTPGAPYFAGGLDNVYGSAYVLLVDGTRKDYVINGRFVPENVDYAVNIIYGGDIHAVKYVDFTLYDEVANSNLKNTIAAYADVSCAPDNGVVLAPPPTIMDPPGSHWRSANP